MGPRRRCAGEAPHLHRIDLIHASLRQSMTLSLGLIEKRPIVAGDGERTVGRPAQHRSSKRNRPRYVRLAAGRIHHRSGIQHGWRGFQHVMVVELYFFFFPRIVRQEVYLSYCFDTFFTQLWSLRVISGGVFVA